MAEMNLQMQKLTEATRFLAECKTIPEAKKILDMAEACRHYACVMKLGGEASNYATEIKLRAERRLGEILKTIPRATVGDNQYRGSSNPYTTSLPTLADMNITRTQSSRWQRAAQVPEETFEAHVAEIKAKPDGELTSAGVRRLAKQIARKEKQNGMETMARAGLYTIDDAIAIVGDAREMDSTQFPHRYGVIVADPPWPYRVAKGQGIAEDQYAVMTDADLCAMPIRDIAAADCALFLWGTWPKLPEATRLMAAWGFEYVTGLPWVKTNSKNGQPFYGVGYWVRGCSEYVLIGRRGSVSPPRMRGFMGILSPGFKHSRKPDSVHQIAEALPGPYLELFARHTRSGWTVFGNEIEEVLL